MGRAAARREAAAAARMAEAAAAAAAEEESAASAAAAAVEPQRTAAGEKLVKAARKVVQAEMTLAAMTGSDMMAGDEEVQRKAKSLEKRLVKGLGEAEAHGLSEDDQRVLNGALRSLSKELGRVEKSDADGAAARIRKERQAEEDDEFVATGLGRLRPNGSQMRKPHFDYADVVALDDMAVEARTETLSGKKYLDQFVQPVHREMLWNFAHSMGECDKERLMKVRYSRMEVETDGSLAVVVNGSLPSRVEPYFLAAFALVALEKYDLGPEVAPAGDVGAVVALDFMGGLLHPHRSTEVKLRFKDDAVALKTREWLEKQKKQGEATRMFIIGSYVEAGRVRRSVEILKEVVGHPVMKEVLPAPRTCVGSDGDSESDSVGPSAASSIAGPEDPPAAPTAHAEGAAGGLNASQAAAVQRFCTHGAAVTIVEGPPGTGKTRTVTAALKRRGVSMKRRALVVAPSNAALHVLMRGVLREMPNCRHVLTGVADKVPEDLAKYSPDYTMHLLKERMQDLCGTLFAERRVNGTRKAQRQFFEEVQREVQFFDRQLEALHRLGAAESVRRLGALQLQDRDTVDRKRKDLHEAYKQLTDVDVQQEATDKAEIVFATAVASGRGYFQAATEDLPAGGKAPTGRKGFATLVVDEAAHFTEAAMMIPLATFLQNAPNDAKLLMVGDVKQLAGQGSEEFTRAGFTASLMEVLLRRGHAGSFVLQTQYRMHPEISAFPFAEFYQGARYNIQNAESVSTRPSVLPKKRPEFLAPLRMVASDEPEEQVGTSFRNDGEVATVLQVLCELKHAVDSQPRQKQRRPSVAVITFYRAQAERLNEAFEEAGAPFTAHTVDAFQGEEFDVVVLSMVRNFGEDGSSKGFGFVKDTRRLNVALTRARHSLILVGSHYYMEGARGAIARLGDHLRGRVTDARSL